MSICMSVCLYQCIYMCAGECRDQKRILDPKERIISSVSYPKRHWEQNLDPLEKQQQVLLTTNQLSTPRNVL